MPAAKTTLRVPGSGSRRAPPPGLTSQGRFLNEFESKPTNLALQNRKTHPDPEILCQKLWTCWLSILRTKTFLHFNLFFFFFPLIQNKSCGTLG